MALFNVAGFLPVLVGCFMTPSALSALVHDCHRVFGRSLLAVKRHTRTLKATRTPAPEKAPVRLPVDVLHRILDLAHYNDDLDVDRKLLASCALVCREWSLVSQPLLFHHVQLQSQSAFESFSAAVKHHGTKGRRLAHSVARLHIVLDYGSPEKLSMESAVEAVLLSSNLFELELSVFGHTVRRDDMETAVNVELAEDKSTPSFDADILAMLGCGPQITALRVNNWSGNDQLALQLLSIWPTLSSVHLTGLAPVVRQTESPDEMIAPFPCALREVHLSFQSSPSLSFATWLLRSSSESLRVLQLEREMSPELSKLLISQHKSTLSSLTLHACTHPGLTSLIQECLALKELQFMDTHVSPQLFKKLPRALQHLAFAIDRNTMIHAAVDGIGAMKTLRRITVQVRREGRVHPSLPSLKVACVVNGVVLVRASSPRAFRALIRGDPLHTPIFPRAKNTMNLKTMLSISRSKDCAISAPRVFASTKTDCLHACELFTSIHEQVEEKELSKADPTSVFNEE